MQRWDAAAEASHVRRAHPFREDSIDPEHGKEQTWFQRSEFVASIPPLPVELRPSHAEELSGWGFIGGAVAVLFGGAIVLWPLSLIFPGGAPRWLGDPLFVAYLAAMVVGGIMARRRTATEKRRGFEESWCRITDDGIVFNGPDVHCDLAWDEITDVRLGWDSGRGEDETYNVVEVSAGERKLRMSARFFTDREVELVHGICRLKAGV